MGSSSSSRKWEENGIAKVCRRPACARIVYGAVGLFAFYHSGLLLRMCALRRRAWLAVLVKVPAALESHSTGDPVELPLAGWPAENHARIRLHIKNHIKIRLRKVDLQLNTTFQKSVYTVPNNLKLYRMLLLLNISTVYPIYDVSNENDDHIVATSCHLYLPQLYAIS